MIDLIKLEGCICYSRMYLNYCIFFMKRPLVTSFPLSLLITDTGFVTRLTRRVPLVEQELLTLPEHLSSPLFLVGFVLLDLSFMCMFCRSLFVLLYFLFWPLCCLFFDIYGFWLHLWYLQTLLIFSFRIFNYAIHSLFVHFTSYSLVTTI
jgi:hypothetical protein